MEKKDDREDKNISMSYVFQKIWNKMDKKSLQIVIDSILERNIDPKLKEELIVWIHHNQGLSDDKFDFYNLAKSYSFISDSTISSILKNLDKQIYSCTSDCPICHNTITDPHVTSNCGHVFCKECITKYFRLCALRNNEKKCPKCRNVIEGINKIYL